MATDTVAHLGVELGYRFFSSVLEESKEAQAIHAHLVEVGLDPQPERSHLFNVFSPDSLKSVAIAITPFVSEDLEREAGMSVSQGGHAQAVIVEMSNRINISAFTHIAVSDGEVVTSRHSVKELARGRPSASVADDHVRAFAEKVGKVKAAAPLVEIEARQTRSLASVAYNSLLGDSFSETVHDEREISALRANTNIVAQIGLFVLFRTEGSACCSCSCSCWGSSSCSTSSVG